jgi:hypothetical protein
LLSAIAKEHIPVISTIIIGSTNANSTIDPPSSLRQNTALKRLISDSSSANRGVHSCSAAWPRFKISPVRIDTFIFLTPSCDE